MVNNQLLLKNHKVSKTMVRVNFGAPLQTPLTVAFLARLMVISVGSLTVEERKLQEIS